MGKTQSLHSGSWQLNEKGKINCETGMHKKIKAQFSMRKGLGTLLIGGVELEMDLERLVECYAVDLWWLINFTTLADSPITCKNGWDGKESACNEGDLGLIHGLGRSLEEGNGYPLQYSCLENSMAGYSTWVAKSRTQLSTLHFLFSVHY